MKYSGSAGLASAPGVAAVAEEPDVRVARELVDRGRSRPSAPTRMVAATRATRCGSPASRRRRGKCRNPAAAVRLRVEAARGRRHLAGEFRRRARVVQQLELRVAVEAADDLVVVQLHHRIPVIHHLRELREREAPEIDPGRQVLAAIRSADLGDDALERGAVVGPLADQHRAVRLAVLFPGDFRAFASSDCSASCSSRCDSADFSASDMATVAGTSPSLTGLGSVTSAGGSAGGAISAGGGAIIHGRRGCEPCDRGMRAVHRWPASGGRARQRHFHDLALGRCQQHAASR